MQFSVSVCETGVLSLPQGGYRACSRLGIDSNASPFLKISFETATAFLTEATLRGAQVRQHIASHPGMPCLPANHHAVPRAALLPQPYTLARTRWARRLLWLPR